jgi:hypothetical protein
VKTPNPGLSPEKGQDITALHVATDQPLLRRFGDLQSTNADPEWLWNGLLAPSLVTLLVGPAFSGKSTLIAALLRSMTTGEPLLGQPVEPGQAVWLSEEADVSLLHKATRFGISESGHSFAGRQDRLTWCEWESMIETAAAEALERSARLLIVDSFAALARLDPEHENDAGAIAQKMAALSAATRRDLAVLVLHHSNANGRPRGSTAFEGSADIVVRLKRRAETITLKSASRFTPVELTGRLENNNPQPQFKAVANSTEHTSPRTPENDLLWQALNEAGREGITYAELDDQPGLSRFMAMRRLRAWRANNLVDCRGGGVKGDPRRWFIVDSVR